MENHSFQIGVLAFSYQEKDAKCCYAEHDMYIHCHVFADTGDED